MARQSSPIDEAFHVNGFPLLEFDRRPFHNHLLTGFVLGWNAKLTLIQIVEDQQFRLNGYAIFRNSDVKRWRPVSKELFLARAARIHKLRPERPRAATLASLKDVISSAGSVFPLLTIHREYIKRGVCDVGKLVRVSQRVMTILSITPQAEWEEEESYLLKDITLLEFGGAYEKLLSRMSKKRPASAATSSHSSRPAAPRRSAAPRPGTPRSPR